MNDIVQTGTPWIDNSCHVIDYDEFENTQFAIKSLLFAVCDYSTLKHFEPYMLLINPNHEV